MATLYEINEQILECIDLESGEVLDAERLEALQIARGEKIKSVGEWYKNCLSDAAAYKAEKDNFAEKQKAAERKAESLKKWLDNALQGTPFKSTTVNINYRKSEQVVIDDINSLDINFVKYPEPQADKVEIKKALKAGVNVQGAHLEAKNNISIK